MAVAALLGQRHDLGCHQRRQRMVIGRIVHRHHAGHAIQRRSGIRCAGQIAGAKQRYHHLGCIQLFGTSHNATHGLSQHAAGLLTDNQHLAHYSSPLFFSSLTNSSALATLRPPPRAAGASVLTTFRAAAGSTPRSARLTVSMGFFLAFMMSGSLT